MSRIINSVLYHCRRLWPLSPPLQSASALVLTILLIAALAACGGDAPEPGLATDTPEATSVSITATTPGPTDSPTSVPGPTSAGDPQSATRLAPATLPVVQATPTSKSRALPPRQAAGLEKAIEDAGSLVNVIDSCATAQGDIPPISTAPLEEQRRWYAEAVFQYRDCVASKTTGVNFEEE